MVRACGSKFEPYSWVPIIKGELGLEYEGEC